MTTYKYGTIKGKAGCKRINPKTNDCEFILWSAGKHGHQNDYWHRMGDGWKGEFIEGCPTELQKSNRLED
jgi:hypothetical protein